MLTKQLVAHCMLTKNLIDCIDIPELHYDRTHMIGQRKSNGNGDAERPTTVTA